MALHIDLRQRNTNQKYTLPLVRGTLSELNDVPMGSGTFTYDKHNVVINIMVIATQSFFLK